jgi:1-acyl-sn-glycerol-3-phosphate acyltransferase
MRVTDSSQIPPGWSLDRRNPETIEALMPIWGWFYRYYFRVQTSGWEHVPSTDNALVVGSHNGGLAAPDMFMVMYDWFRRFGVERLAYGLMHPAVWQFAPAVAHLAEQVGALVAHPKMAITALERGASLLVYPGGPEDVFRPHHLRHQIYFAERRGFIKLALLAKVPIVPVVSTGAHDTLLVLADLYPELRQLHDQGMPWLFGIDPVVFPVYFGLPWGLAFGPLPHIPIPVPIHTRICPPIWFEYYGRDAVRDRTYVDACYEKVRTLMQQELDCLSQQTSQ